MEVVEIVATDIVATIAVTKGELELLDKGFERMRLIKSGGDPEDIVAAMEYLEDTFPKNIKRILEVVNKHAAASNR